MTMRDLKVFGSPGLYVQGPGAIQELGQLIAGIGERALLVSDEMVCNLLVPKVEPVLAAAGVEFAWVGFTGDVTPANVERMTDEKRDFAPDVVIAAGGGKGMDAGKAVCRAFGARLVSLPTAASNDGPTSRNFVFYDDNHKLLSVEKLVRNPDLVLVDTSIIINAPPALLVSGIGDALVKRFEAAQCVAANGPNMFGGRATLTSPFLAEMCDRVLRENSVAALAAVRTRTPDESFEKIIEACFLLSGLGFEGSGLSIAHAMTRGLSAVPQTAAALHGYQVAYALLVQFVLERRGDDFMREQFAFYRQVGLPISLGDLGLTSASPQDLETIATLTHRAPHTSNFERELIPDDLVEAMKRLEAISADYPACAA
jgi:glycerol dehydrogenase